jgi:hypothetical protein
LQHALFTEVRVYYKAESACHFVRNLKIPPNFCHKAPLFSHVPVRGGSQTSAERKGTKQCLMELAKDDTQAILRNAAGMPVTVHRGLLADLEPDSLFTSISHHNEFPTHPAVRSKSRSDGFFFFQAGNLTAEAKDPGDVYGVRSLRVAHRDSLTSSDRVGRMHNRFISFAANTTKTPTS